MKMSTTYFAKSAGTFDSARKLSVYDRQKRFIYSPDDCLHLIESHFGRREYNSVNIYNAEQLVGHALVSCCSNRDDNILVDNFFIDKVFQGRGIGSSAFIKLLDYINECYAQCKSIELFVHVENVSAIAMFATCGFVKNKFINVNKEELMTLNIDDKIHMHKKVYFEEVDLQDVFYFHESSYDNKSFLSEIVAT